MLKPKSHFHLFFWKGGRDHGETGGCGKAGGATNILKLQMFKKIFMKFHLFHIFS